MSNADRGGFIVKFVESKGQKTEHAVKAYEVWYHLVQTYCWLLYQHFADDNVCLLFTQAILELQSEKYLKTVDEDAVLQMDQRDKSLFVFSSFSTPAFLHCKKVWLHLNGESWIVSFGEYFSSLSLFVFCHVAWLPCGEPIGGVVLSAAAALCPQSREAHL